MSLVYRYQYNAKLDIIGIQTIDDAGNLESFAIINTNLPPRM